MNSNEIKTRNRVHPKHDVLSGIITGLFFIIAGVLILADNRGLLFEGWFWWFLFAGGILFLAEALFRTLTEKYKRPVTSRVVWGSIFLATGGSQIYDFENWWPLVLVFAGSLLILHALKSTPKPTT